MEQKIRVKYGSDSFFLTALGSVFHIDNFIYAEKVNSFLSQVDGEMIELDEQSLSIFLKEKSLNVIIQNIS